MSLWRLSSSLPFCFFFNKKACSRILYLGKPQGVRTGWEQGQKLSSSTASPPLLWRYDFVAYFTGLTGPTMGLSPCCPQFSNAFVIAFSSFLSHHLYFPPNLHLFTPAFSSNNLPVSNYLSQVLIDSSQGVVSTIISIVIFIVMIIFMSIIITVTIITQCLFPFFPTQLQEDVRGRDFSDRYLSDTFKCNWTIARDVSPPCGFLWYQLAKEHKPEITQCRSYNNLVNYYDILFLSLI